MWGGQHPEGNTVSQPTPIEGISDVERQLLLGSLRALLRERGATWCRACDLASQQKQPRPSLQSYGVDDIGEL